MKILFTFILIDILSINSVNSVNSCNYQICKNCDNIILHKNSYLYIKYINIKTSKYKIIFKSDDYIDIYILYNDTKILKQNMSCYSNEMYIKNSNYISFTITNNNKYNLIIKHLFKKQQSNLYNLYWILGSGILIFIIISIILIVIKYNTAPEIIRNPVIINEIFYEVDNI